MRLVYRPRLSSGFHDLLQAAAGERLPAAEPDLEHSEACGLPERVAPGGGRELTLPGGLGEVGGVRAVGAVKGTGVGELRD